MAEFLRAANFSVIGLAENGIDAYDLIKKHNPDIAILDIEMPGMSGLEIAEKKELEFAKTKIILLSYLKDPEFVFRAKTSNISGYLVKEDAMLEIKRCIRNVLAGERYFSKNLGDMDAFPLEGIMSNIQSLTPSERKILKYIGKGMSSKNISQLLCVSQRTVEKHRSNIISKLNIESNSMSISEWLQKNEKLLGDL